MRGKEKSAILSLLENRITPAYAGKSQQAQVTCESYGDHPRLCGEKKGSPGIKSSILGSPPPMRGKASGVFSVNERKRITPAYAGKRKYKKHTNDHAKDHPRLCGEKPEAQILKVR